MSALHRLTFNPISPQCLGGRSSTCTITTTPPKQRLECSFVDDIGFRFNGLCISVSQNDNPFQCDETLALSNSQNPIRRTLNFALLYGATPLVVGVAIYVCWRVTAWPWLMQAGAVTLFVGMIFFVLGLAACWKARSRLHEVADVERGLSSGLIMLALVLLLANWPVAFWLASDAIGNGQATEVAVQNNTATPLSDVSFSWASTKGDFGTIDAGSTASKKCRVSLVHSSMVYINYKSGNLKSEIRVSLKCRENLLAPITVAIRDDGSVHSSAAGGIEHQLTQNVNIDASGRDKIVFRYGQTDFNQVEVERVTNGESRWIEFADQLDKSQDTYIQNARISIDGDEFHLYCEGDSGKYHERRKLDSGELIERSEDLTLVPESIDGNSD